MPSGDYLVAALMKAGPCKSNGQAELPLDWVDVWAFMRATEEITEPWEADALHKMSRGYLVAKLEGENPLCIAPVDRDQFQA